VDVDPTNVASIATLQQLVIALDFNKKLGNIQSLAPKRKGSKGHPAALSPSSSAFSSQQAKFLYPTAEGGVSHQLSNEIEVKKLDLQPIREENGRFSSWVVDILQRWFLEHAIHPWPTNEQKLALMEQTGLKRSMSTPQYPPSQLIIEKTTNKLMQTKLITGWEAAVRNKDMP